MSGLLDVGETPLDVKSHLTRRADMTSCKKQLIGYEHVKSRQQISRTGKPLIHHDQHYWKCANSQRLSKLLSQLNHHTCQKFHVSTPGPLCTVFTRATRPNTLSSPLKGTEMYAAYAKMLERRP